MSEIKLSNEDMAGIVIRRLRNGLKGELSIQKYSEKDVEACVQWLISQAVITQDTLFNAASVKIPVRKNKDVRVVQQGDKSGRRRKKQKAS